MKKKILLTFSLMFVLVFIFALCVSASRIENYDETYTLVNSSKIKQYLRHYSSETSYSKMMYTDTISVTFVDADGNTISEVPLWEYDEAEDKYYSLVWYISDWEYVTETAEVVVSDVTYTRDKYVSAVYTLDKARAVDLRYTHNYTESWSFSTSSVGYDYKYSVQKPLHGIFLDINNTPEDTTDDYTLQESKGIGRDTSDYGYIGWEAQFEATGNKIVVANFRDCDFDADATGNYGTKQTWSLATNLQCLYYPDTFKYMVSPFSSIYKIDLGDGLEVINCQILRDNKVIKDLKLPNSLIYLSNEAFRGTDLTTLTVGEGLIYHGGSPFLYTGCSDNIYLSKNLLSTLTSNVTAFTGTSITIYFDGDFTEATALMERMISESSSYDGKITLIDYNTQTERNGVNNVALFYNYSTCDAFYFSQHSHELSKMSYPDGFGCDGICTYTCSRCPDSISELAAPIISSLGYASDVGTTERTIIASGYTVDMDLVDLYNSTNDVALEIGIFLSSAEAVADSAPTSLEGFNYFSNKGANDYSIYDFKVRFPAKTDESYERFATAEFVASSFVYDGTAYYFYQGCSDDTVVSTLASGFTTTTLAKVSGTEACEHTGEWVLTPATCTTPATKEKVCTVCGEAETIVDESVPGHSWSDWQEGFLYIERACTVDGCDEAQRLDYQNITSSLVTSPSTQITFEGQAWGSYNTPNLVNGVWDEENSNTVCPQAVDCTVTITLDTSVCFDRIYVKNRGYASIIVEVFYDGDLDYTTVATLNSVSGTVSEATIPYATIDSTRSVYAVRITLDNPSNGTDFFEEIAFVTLPNHSEYAKTDTVTVAYDTGSGYFENEFDSEIYVDTNTTFTAHPTPTNTNKSLLFTGWYKDVNCTISASAEDVYASNTTLYAGWVENTSCSDGTNNHSVDSWNDDVPATCYSTGSKSGVCINCGKTVTETTQTIPHTETTVPSVDPTCIDTGLTEETVCSVCGTHISGGELIAPTGIHSYDEASWTTVVLATKYTNGLATNSCSVCSAEGEKALPYTATEEELSANNVGVTYTGGSYTNEIFTNLSPLGRVYATSFFNGTEAGYAIDKDYNTFWNADTYVDGADYSSDYIELELPAKYDVGVISLIIPNYSSYELGDDCYVSYNIEYWDEDAQAWVYIGTASDQDAISMGESCQAVLTLESPITTQKIRASVAYATRYAPAVIYELEVFGKANGFDYAIESVAGQASASISGKYNDWVSGAEALLDGDVNTYWTTDIRNGGPTWALLEFPTDIYITCLQFTVRNEESRTFTVEVYENGEWVQIGGYYVASTTVGESIISNLNNTCTFNIDIEKNISKIKITLTHDSAYWVSYVHEITPYTVAGTTSDDATTECKHVLLSTNKVVSPTCTSTGYTLVECSGCGAQFKSNATDKLSHSFGEYVISTPASSTTVGTKVADCANCDATSTVTYEESYEAPIVTPYRHDAPAAWAQTFDDGNYSETYDWVIPQLQKYGYRATALLSITFANTHVSAWNERLNSGVFDLGSHSYNHLSIYSGNINATDLLSDVVMAQYWFRSNFKGQKVVTFATPNGTTSDDVARYLAGIFAANRNGGQGNTFYNIISDLDNGRDTWGSLNTYVSKKDQTEGDYVFTNADGSIIYTLDENGSYVINDSYANIGINYVFDESAETFVNKGYSAGTYYYVSEDYRYDFYETGSYNLVDGEFVFVNDNSGEFKLVKATIGSYESAIDTLVSNGAFTVECLHSLGVTNVIYSSYNSTISKFEYLAKRGVWAPSYQDLVLYLKEAQNAKIETLERTDESMTINVTDDLDDYIFDYALTVKVDISDSWKSVTVTQNGVEIPLVSIDTYRTSKNMSAVSCSIEGGYLYIDIIPDGGEIVITAEATLEETENGGAQVGVDIWDILG